MCLVLLSSPVYLCAQGLFFSVYVFPISKFLKKKIAAVTDAMVECTVCVASLIDTGKYKIITVSNRTKERGK